MVLPVRISEWRSGYVVAVGLEYGITQLVGAGNEYNCMDFCGGKTWNGSPHIRGTFVPVEEPSHSIDKPDISPGSN